MTLDEFQALSHPERRLLRRAAFGDGGAVMMLPPQFDRAQLAQIRDMLVAENERTGTFPEKWTNQTGEDE